MNLLHPSALLGSLLLAFPAAHAQTTFRFGPSVAGVLSTASLDSGLIHTTHLGFEAGVLACLQRGHFALQPALRYAQRRFGWQAAANLPDGLSEEFCLHYLTLPVQLAYTQHADGRGFQVFAGPSVSWLLGGHYTVSGGLAGRQWEGDVVVADAHTAAVYTTTQVPDNNFYARRLDLGAQAGVGYQWGRTLLQASYSLGLRNVATPTTYTLNGVPAGSYGPRYYNRAALVAVSYLLGGRN